MARSNSNKHSGLADLSHLGPSQLSGIDKHTKLGPEKSIKNMTQIFTFRAAKKDGNFYHFPKIRDVNGLLVTKTANKLVFPGH